VNIFALIILTTIIAEFTIEFIADKLNLSMITDNIPESFKDIYDRDSYKKSQNYLKVNTRFDWLTSSFGTLLIIGFWFLKGFPALDIFLSSFGLGPIVTGVLFMGTLIFANSLLSLPFSLYKTFVIEEKFGFNKTTVKTYFMDMIKSAVLGTLIGAPLLAGILAFFQYAGSLAWLYCWITVVISLILLQYLIPVWIMPLFNKFEPIEDGELKEAILNYAASINFSLKNVFKMDGSKRSAKSNAFFTGFGKNKRIVLFDTLINQHTTSELVAVLAHEMGHFKKKHIMYSRKNEFEADTFAAETTNNPDAMTNALKKLYVSNLGNLHPHPFYVFLNYSHPPVIERINNISVGQAKTE